MSGILLATLTGCSIQKVDSSRPNSSKSEVKAKVERAKKPAVESPTETLRQKEAVVKRFVAAYTTYSSVKHQKAAIKPLLTGALQEELAVNQPVSPDADKVSSAGQDISVWRNDNGEFLGVATVRVNDQTSSVQVFMVGLAKEGNNYVVSKLSLPTMN